MEEHVGYIINSESKILKSTSSSSCQITPRGLCGTPDNNEIPILDYMGWNWSTPEDVLHYLLRNANARRILKRVADFAKPTEEGFVVLIHPLLTSPIRVKDNSDDIQIRKAIRDCLKKERGTAVSNESNQIVLYRSTIFTQ